MKNFSLLLFFLLSALAVQTHAQTTLSFQGVVKNSDGTAVDNGNYSIIFNLYESFSGGSPIWTEVQPAVNVKDGVYSTVLGGVTPLDVPFTTTYYLGVAVEGGLELVPRIQLTAAPYALSVIGNSNVVPNDGNVGVGTLAPEEKLHVIGNLKVDGDLEVTGTAPSGPLPPLPDSIAYGDDPYRIMIGAADIWNGVTQGSGFTVQFDTPSNYNTIFTFDEPFAAPPIIMVNYGHLNFHGTVKNVTASGFEAIAFRSQTPAYDGNGPWHFIAIGLR